MKCNKTKKFVHEAKKLKLLADILLELSANDMARLIKLGELCEAEEYV